MIHRDIKPANILIAPDSTVKVVDFGIAALLDPKVATTRIGNPMCVPLEHVTGSTNERSDIYAFGVNLYQALAGRLPPQFALEPAWPDRRLDAQAPPVLDATILRAVQREPGSRFLNVAEFDKGLT